MYRISAVLVNGKMTKRDAKKAGIIAMNDGRFAKLFLNAVELDKWVAKN